MDIFHDKAVEHPEKIAILFPDREAIGYAELDARANRVALWLISLGLEPGDGIAMLMENHPRTFELWLGARRAGLYYTPLSIHLTSREVADILVDCAAKVLISTTKTAPISQQLSPMMHAENLRHFVVGDEIPGSMSYEAAIGAIPDSDALPNHPIGREFIYSSGTTGKPKGIRRPLSRYEDRYLLPEMERRLRGIFEFSKDTIYLSPSPLYHSTGRFNLRVIESGGTAVVMEKFDAESALETIERYRITHSHWVPTMFVRLLTLPQEVRSRYDLSSTRHAIHAAAACPPDIKERMIKWWGPVLDEYYAGSENAGLTYIDSNDWQSHRGSVGRPICGAIHIVGEDGTELGTDQVGQIYFSGGVGFAYHNDPVKTASAVNDRGWATYGDLGHLDSEGYLYISDRRTDLIVTGGVNVYPQEIENVLLAHHAVFDAAVVGIPDAVYGEQVRAVVQLKPDFVDDPLLPDELVAFCASRLSRIKCPRHIDFVASLPRTETGKLLRRIIKERYRSV